MIRDATPDDLADLCRMRDTAAAHETRLREAATGTVRFLVAVAGGEVAGFASPFLAHPKAGPAKSRVPKLSDCYIAAPCRSHGLGRALVEAREAIARAADLQRLYVSIDPVGNPRWFECYRNCGYETLQPAPYRKRERRHLPDGGTQELLVWRQDLVVDLLRMRPNELGLQDSPRGPIGGHAV